MITAAFVPKRAVVVSNMTVLLSIKLERRIIINLEVLERVERNERGRSDGSVRLVSQVSFPQAGKDRIFRDRQELAKWRGMRRRIDQRAVL